MIKYVGIKTKEEVNQINDDFLLRANQHNKKVKTRRGAISAIVLIALLSIAIPICLLFVDYWKMITLALGIVSFVAQFVVLKSCNKDLMGTDDCDKPVAWQFFKATDGRQIVGTDICPQKHGDNVDLRLSVKDNDDEVSVEYVRNFKLVSHQGTKNVVVDLNGGVIYQPSIN